MRTLMLYSNLAVLAAVIMSGCASQEVKQDELTQQEQDKAIKQATESDLQKYAEAITLLGNGELDKAKALLLEFTEERPDLAGPWANLGLISIKQDKLDDAEAQLTKAIKRNPDLAQAQNLMGYIEKSRGNIIKARDYYIRAVELKDNYALAHYNLALIYDLYMQDINKAIEHYQKYLALIKNKDKQTAEWLDQLKASLKKG